MIKIFKLKGLLIFTLLLLGVLFSYTNTISAQSNSTINFQGKISEITDGTNVDSTSTSCVVSGASNDTCDFRVRIYDAPSAGTLLFEETHSNVEIGETNGVFNLSLNSVCNDWAGGCAGSGITWGSDPTIYIQIEFDPNGNGDFSEGEIFSRKLLQSVPYAYYADSVNTINGLGVNGLVWLQPGSAQTAANSTSLIWLNETGGGTPNLLELEVGGSDMFVIENDGSMSIGTSTNTAYVTIAGSTTSQASMRLVSSGGIDPTSANSGDLWWNGTNLYFNNGASNIDILGLGGGGPKFTDGGTATYLTETTDDFVIGGSTVANSVFSIDVSTGEYFLGSNGLVNSELVFENANGSIARIGYNVNNNFNIYNGTNDARVSINKAIAEYELDVVGTIQVSEDILTDTVTVDNTSSNTTNTFTGSYPTWITREISSTNAVLGRKITTDADGNVYVIGYFNDDVDFGFGTWSASGWDYFLLKYNSSGTLLWADRENGGTGDVFGNDIAVDASGNVYITAGFSGSVNFSGSLWASTGGGDYVIVKYNSSGTLLWADTENAGSTGQSGGLSVDTDASGNVYISGQFSGTVDFGTGSSLVATGNNFFILKYDGAGNPLWIRSEEGGSGSTNIYLDVDSSGNIYGSGSFTGTVEFFLGVPEVATSSDLFVLKYDTSGTLQWVETVAGGTVIPNAVTSDSTGSIIVGGYFTGTVDFGSGSWSATGDDYFVTKYNTNGVFQWADREDGGGGDVNVNDINVDSDNNVYATGLFDNTQVNFGEGLWTPSVWNYFVIKYNSAGVFQWGHQEAGGTGSSNGRGVSVTLDGIVYVTGYMDGIINFGITTYSSSTAASYFAIRFEDQFDSETTYTYEYIGSDIGSYTNAFANTYTYGLVTRGVSVFEEIINAEGDFIPTAPTLNTSTGASKTFNSVGIDYQWAYVYGTALSSGESVNDVIEDPTTKDIFVVGHFRNTIDADPSGATATLTSNGIFDYFIIKYNSLGEYQWAVSVGGAANEYAQLVRQKSNGNIIVLGEPAGGSVDYDGTGGTDNLSAPNNSIYITEYTSAGAYVGTFFVGDGNGVLYPKTLELDSDNNYYFGGHYSTGSTIDFDNSGGTDAFAATGSQDAFITRYNSDGTYGWTRRWGSASTFHSVADIELDSTNDVIYLTGDLNGTVDVDGTTGGTNNLVSSGTMDILISTYNFDGSYNTSYRIGGTSNTEEGQAIALDSNNNIYLYSIFTGTVDFDPGAGTDNRTVTVRSGALTMFDSNFNYINTRHFGGATLGPDSTNTFSPGILSIDENDEILLSGEYSGLLDFEPAITSNSHTSLGNSDIYLIKFSDINTFEWSYSFGGTGIEQLESMYSKTDFSMYMAGSWTNTVDFDPTGGTDSKVYAGGPSTPNEDGFVSKIITKEILGKHSEIIFSGGLPLIASFNESASEVALVGCFDTTCTSSITTSYPATTGTVGDNEITLITRNNGFPLPIFYDSTGQDLEGIDCTTTSCITGNPRTIDAAAAGTYSTAWVSPATGLTNFGYTATNNAQSFTINCTNAVCSAFAVRAAMGTNVAGNEGQHPSAVVRSNGLPFVFAMDEDDGELEVINCTNDICTTFEPTRVIDSGGDGAGGILVGEHVEAVIGSSGYPIAVYRDVTNQSIKFVRCLDIACSTSSINTLRDNSSNLGVNQLGIALKGTGTPVISYHNETNGTLNVYECASPECSSGVNYELTDGTNDEGEYSSIVRVPGSTDRFLISYYDRTNGDLKLFDFNKTYTGTGVNLGSSTNYFSNLYTANIYSKNATISNFDVAEEYKVEDESIEAGDVVRFKKDSTDKLVVERTDKAYDGEAIGVISTEPGLYLKNWEENDGRGRPVALVGRVPVKVTDENGKIKRGDYLVASNTPGYAMKATEGGVIIGRAMEDFGTEDSNLEKGKIMMYVDIGYMEKNVLDNRESVEESINILSYGMDNGDNLFELIEEVDRSELKINAEVVVKKSLAAERYRSTGGDFIVEVAGAGGFKIIGEGEEELFGVDSKGKISLREGEGGSIGSVEMKIGETELRVLNNSVTNNSKIFVRPDKAIVYGIKEQFDKEGFTIEVSEPLTEDVKFNYWIIN